MNNIKNTNNLIEAIERYIELKQESTAIQNRLEDILLISRRLQTQRLRLKNYLIQYLKDKAETELIIKGLAVRLEKSEQDIEISSKVAIPEEYWRECKRTVYDKQKLKTRLLEGEEIPGVLLKQHYSLVIKPAQVNANVFA